MGPDEDYVCTVAMIFPYIVPISTTDSLRDDVDADGDLDRQAFVNCPNVCVKVIF